jgi:hypothetical protein
MSANLLSNRISLNIPAADLQAIMAAVKTLQDKLLPHLVDLDADDRHALPKMGAKTIDFVTRTLGAVQAHPEFKPAFVDADEFARDLAAVGALRAIQQPLDQIADMVDDSLMLSGSEAYAAALACYQSIKSAARLGQPGAAMLAADLSARFSGRPTKVAAKLAGVGGLAAAPG